MLLIRLIRQNSTHVHYFVAYSSAAFGICRSSSSSFGYVGGSFEISSDTFGKETGIVVRCHIQKNTIRLPDGIYLRISPKRFELLTRSYNFSSLTKLITRKE